MLQVIEVKVHIGDRPFQGLPGSEARGVQGRVDAVGLQPLQHFFHEVDLAERLAAGDGHAAAGGIEKVLVLEEPVHQLLGGVVLPAEGQGFRIALVRAGPAVVAEVPLDVDGPQLLPGLHVRFQRSFLDGPLGAGVHAAITAGVQPQTAHAHPAQLLVEGLALRAVAPGAAQGAALEEGRGADAGPVLHGKALDIVKPSRGHMLISVRRIRSSWASL